MDLAGSEKCILNPSFKKEEKEKYFNELIQIAITDYNSNLMIFWLHQVLGISIIYKLRYPNWIKFLGEKHGIDTFDKEKT